MTLSPKARTDLANRLRHAIAGEILADDYSRGRYATDASPYQSFPAAIALPKTQDDIDTLLHICWQTGISIIARGGGTARAGQAVGEGLVIDFSKHLTRLLYYDASAQSCIVEPGITPDALNEALRPERVRFPVEIGSAHQATIGGMFATDAIGSHVLLHGRMRDNVVACDAILADGRQVSFGEVPEDLVHGGGNGTENALILDLLETAETHEAVMHALSTHVKGGRQAYNLQALTTGQTPQNLAAFLAGSEGTLAIAKRIEVKLARLPKTRAVGVCHFASVRDAINAIPRILKLKPSDIELTNGRIFELGQAAHPRPETVRRILRKQSTAMLIVEFMEGNSVTNARKLKELTGLMKSMGYARSVSELIGPTVQDAARRAHRIGLNRLYGITAQLADFAPADQMALPIKQLAQLADAIEQTLKNSGLDAMWHGQVGVGSLHLHPWIRLGKAIPDISSANAEIRTLLDKYGAELTPVDTYGLAHSFNAERRRNPAHTDLLEILKGHLDPKNRLNPGKIVYPAEPAAPMMRSTPDSKNTDQFLNSALQCDGTALCRRLDKSVMCPSFKLTRDERDSPRGRANALRLASSGDFGTEGLGSKAMSETMSLCVSCKACRSSCPRSVDITRARIGVQQEQVRQHGLTKFEMTAAYLPHIAPRMRSWRHILNLRDLMPWGGRLTERLTGVSGDRPWPHWSSAPFSASRAEPDGKGAEILLFPDTFNNHFDAVTLRSAADVLEASGFRVHLLLPPEEERPFCCGRTFFEAGLVDQAREEARRLIQGALPYIQRGIPLVGLEPGCLLTIRDEFANLLNEEGARELSAASLLFEEVMSQPFAIEALQPQLMQIEAEAMFSAHCHQHSFGTAHLARKVAGIVPGINVIEADPTCCGAGTSFGYQPEKTATSFRMGEMSLFPQIRRAARDTLLIADGFTCRRQISDGTGRTARHTAVLLKLALAAKERFGQPEEGDFKASRRLARRIQRLRRQYFK